MISRTVFIEKEEKVSFLNGLWC